MPKSHPLKYPWLFQAPKASGYLLYQNPDSPFLGKKLLPTRESDMRSKKGSEGDDAVPVKAGPAIAAATPTNPRKPQNIKAGSALAARKRRHKEEIIKL